jgi:hypothetical protein
MEDREFRDLAAVVAEALTVEPPAPRDAAVAALALTYAQAIVAGGDLSKIGPALLAALEALQMSPRARGVKKDDKPAPSPLDEIRDRRARKNRGADRNSATA